MHKALLFFIIFITVSCYSYPRYGKKEKVGYKTTSPNGKVTKHRTVINGITSFYADDFHGKITANGETYDMYGLTAAHKTLPFNTLVKVTNIDNKRSITLRINDRGPYAKGRILDCSYGAAVKLDFVANGTAKVKIEVIEFGDNKYMKRKDK